MTRHIVFNRHQLLAVAKQLEEFPDIVAVDYQFEQDGDPIRIEYIWKDED